MRRLPKFLRLEEDIAAKWLRGVFSPWDFRSKSPQQLSDIAGHLVERHRRAVRLAFLRGVLAGTFGDLIAIGVIAWALLHDVGTPI